MYKGADDLDKMYKFLVEEIIPEMLNEIDFTEESLNALISEDNSYFSNSSSVQDKFGASYKKVINRYSSESILYITLLTAKQKAIQDNLDILKKSKKNEKYDSVIEYLQIQLNNVKENLKVAIDQNNIILHAEEYITNYIFDRYRIR